MGITVVVNPPQPSIPCRDFVVRGTETNRCEQAGRIADRGVIAVARSALLGECRGQPQLRVVMFLAHSGSAFRSLYRFGASRP
jgi:hypothetical protein